jgi:hypothetical protein
MYALVINQQVEKYPYSIGQLRKDNPQVSFPKTPSDDLLVSFNMIRVQPTDFPVYDPMTQRIEGAQPVFSDGQWVQAWNVVPLTADEIAQQQQALQESIVAQTQQRLDDFARTRGYDGILSAATYATSTSPKFAAEGQCCVEARDVTWARLYAILDEVEAGQRPAPNGFADIENELPPLVWPA